MGKPNSRLPCTNYDITLPGGDDSSHAFTVSLAYDLRGDLREVIFSNRGKIGHGIDHMFYDLGVKLSRILQERDPETGAVQPIEHHALLVEDEP